MAKLTTTTKTKTIIYENFKNIDELLQTMEERPSNWVFKNVDPSSQRDETGERKKFSGVNRYSDAMDLMYKGYTDPLDKMKKAILKVGRNDTYQKPRTQTDFVGFAPHVPNMLMNIPTTMINKEKIVQKSKTIHLTYSFCALANVTPDSIINGGINFISLVNSLEKQGYRVKIDIIFISMTDDTASLFTVTVKEYGQGLNLLKLAFPLVHPAMLRRISFKWLETTPTLKDKGYVGGYGTTLGMRVGNNSQREKEWLNKNGLLTNDNSYYCNVYDAMDSKDVQELGKKMGLNV
jgi:hypothetical protein